MADITFDIDFPETGRRVQSLLRRASAGTVNDPLEALCTVVEHGHLSL